MKVRVRFFSLTRERAGLPEVPVELPSGSTVQECLGRLRLQFPGLGGLLEPAAGLCVVAVNRAYSPLDARLNEGDEVAVFPPVSGGAPDEVPLGVVLLSGGFDSPVAAHGALQQGHRLEAVHFSMEPFTDDASTRKAVALAGMLGIPRVTVAQIGPELAQIAKTCQPGCYFVLQKRLMVRIAQTLAAQRGARFLLTGENLGQVSSQTLPNLAAIDAVAVLPVLRPLLGWDKVDIIRVARQIGTFETSKGPEVCDVLGPRHPDTSVTLERIRAEEAKIDPDGLVRAALSRARVVETQAAARL